MRNFMRFLQVFVLGTWLGAIIFFSFAVPKAVFGILASRDEAGAVVGSTLGQLHFMGVIAAIIYLVASLALWRSSPTFGKIAALAVVMMLSATLVSSHIVIPRMDALRAEMGSMSATPAGDSRRAEFDRLHGVSVELEGGVLLMGILALFLTVKTAGEKS
jgi:Domain of unknown function (DUF4149)